jgi:hypothetical protein
MTMERPFIDWTAEMLRQALAIRWRIIADIEQLLNEPNIDQNHPAVANLKATSHLAALTATQIEQELQRRAK